MPHLKMSLTGLSVRARPWATEVDRYAGGRLRVVVLCARGVGRAPGCGMSTGVWHVHLGVPLFYSPGMRIGEQRIMRSRYA